MCWILVGAKQVVELKKPEMKIRDESDKEFSFEWERGDYKPWYKEWINVRRGHGEGSVSL